QEAWLDRYARIGTELEQVYARAVAAGHSSDEALELYDDAVDAAGLCPGDEPATGQKCSVGW
ncbi:MAG TPA: hypothetical protein VNA11_12150, partial [Pseudonocardia sp.]|nr:hypothetical protein [Pseudonocardia sp.]